MEDNVVPHERVRSLREAVNKARIADADRGDALEERRQSETVRLDLVVRELEDVFKDAAEKNDQFVFEISKGATPRLWIDATSHVVMANDIRSYRFVKDTRLGRIVLAETDDISALADRVTAYVAERIVDLERTVEADWQIWRLNEQAQKEAAEAAAREQDAAETADEPPAKRRRGGSMMAFIVGLLVGGAALAGYLQVSGLYDFRTHLSALQSVTSSSFPTLKPASEAETPSVQTPAAASGSSDGSSATAKPAE